jgi:hypothetical protein
MLLLLYSVPEHCSSRQCTMHAMQDKDKTKKDKNKDETKIHKDKDKSERNPISNEPRIRRRNSQDAKHKAQSNTKTQHNTTHDYSGAHPLK